MPSKHDPAASIADILDNIASVESYTSGMSIEVFAADKRTRDAVERCIERICEAAFRLGDAAGELMPNQPWHNIAAWAIGFAMHMTESIRKPSGTPLNTTSRR